MTTTKKVNIELWTGDRVINRKTHTTGTVGRYSNGMIPIRWDVYNGYQASSTSCYSEFFTVRELRAEMKAGNIEKIKTPTV
jgi:hypothetical protein